MNGKYIKSYATLIDAIKDSGSCSIYSSCKNLLAQSCGYIWLYNKNDLQLHLNMIKAKRNANQKNVCKFDLHGNLLEKYNSIILCAKKNGVDRNAISRCCNEKQVICKGYIFLCENSELEERLKRKLCIINNRYKKS